MQITNKNFMLNSYALQIQSVGKNLQGVLTDFCFFFLRDLSVNFKIVSQV